MKTSQAELGQRFKSLHSKTSGFLLPNVWDAGSAKLLELAGFNCIASTSAGVAFAQALPDHQCLSRDQMLEALCDIVRVVDIPVSADLESGYGHQPEQVAETIRLAIEAGVVGANIEDATNDPTRAKLYDQSTSEARIAAAREAADRTDITFTLNARIDSFLVDAPNAFDDAVERAARYTRAGADCIFVPGLTELDEIKRLADRIEGPLNVVVGLTGGTSSTNDLFDHGANRISIGGSLARAALGFIRRSAEEMKTQGTFSYANGQINHGELCQMFSPDA